MLSLAWVTQEEEKKADADAKAKAGAVVEAGMPEFAEDRSAVPKPGDPHPANQASPLALHCHRMRPMGQTQAALPDHMDAN
jgi:hypothetical protein